MQRQTIFQAFSLTEMLAVISIIGILSVITIPSMQRLVVQAKVSDMLNAATTVKTQVAQSIASTEDVTDSGALIPDTDSDPSLRLGGNVASYSVSNNGVITLTGTTEVRNIIITLTPTYDITLGIISWNCAVTDASFNSLVPSNCQL